MPSLSDIAHLPWPELVGIAAAAVTSKDIDTLHSLSALLHIKYWELDQHKKDKQKITDFIHGVLTVLDADPIRDNPEPDQVQKALLSWQHLSELATSERESVDESSEVRDLIESRKHWKQVVEMLFKAPPGQGLWKSEIEENLDIKEANGSMLLTEMCDYEVITRSKVGKQIKVGLGHLGTSYLEANRPAPQYQADYSAGASRTNRPITNRDVYIPEEEPTLQP